MLANRNLLALQFHPSSVYPPLLRLLIDLSNLQVRLLLRVINTDPPSDNTKWYSPRARMMADQTVRANLNVNLNMQFASGLRFVDSTKMSLHQPFIVNKQSHR